MTNKLITTGNIKPLLTDVAEKINDINEQLEPQTVNIEYPNNTAQVGVDATGTKYNMIESPESTIELNGRTSVNIASNFKARIWRTDLGVTISNHNVSCTIPETYSKVDTYWGAVGIHGDYPIDNSKNYTLFLNITKNTLSGRCIINRFGTVANLTLSSYTINNGVTGNFRFLLKNDPKNANWVNNDVNNAWFTFGHDTGCLVGEQFEASYFLLEGDYTNVPLEYFEGLKSVGETNGVIEVKSTGKNLIDIVNDEHSSIGTNTFVIKDNKITFNPTPNLYGIRYDIGDKLEIGKTYKMSFDYEGDELISSYGFRLVAKDGTNVYPDGTTIVPKATFTINKEIEAVQIYVGMPYTGQKQITLSNIQIEEGTNFTEYEPYKEQVVTLPEIEPLRSLPNGVCDEAFIHDDKLVVTRNVGQATLNGNENGWWRNTVTDLREGMFVASISLEYALSNIPTSGIPNPLVGGAVCDKLVVRADTNSPSIYTVGNSLVIAIPNTHTPNSTIDEFKTWLSNNNITIAYQLATPTYEWYELPSPHLYKEGNLFIETGVIPLTANSHEINVSMRSVIDTNVEEIMQIKEELNTLDLEVATQEDVSDMWQELLEGGNN